MNIMTGDNDRCYSATAFFLAFLVVFGEDSGVGLISGLDSDALNIAVNTWFRGSFPPSTFARMASEIFLKAA